MKLEKQIIPILIILLLIMLFKLPYGAYMAIRVFVTIGFGILAYKANKSYGENSTTTTFYLIGGLLFQPIFKIPLGRTIWIGADVVIAILLVYILLNKNLERK